MSRDSPGIRKSTEWWNPEPFLSALTHVHSLCFLPVSTIISQGKCVNLFQKNTKLVCLSGASWDCPEKFTWDMARWRVNAAARWLMRSFSHLSPPWACEVHSVATHRCPRPEPIILMWVRKFRGEWVPCPWFRFLGKEIKAQMDCNTAHFGYNRCTHERSVVCFLPSCQLRSGA